MKKRTNLKKIALMGVAGGILVAQSQAHAAQQGNNSYYDQSQYYTADENDTSSQKAPTKMMTESDLMSKLSADGKSIYNMLDSDGKALALKLANQSCKGQNSCKGLNSCKTADNACAGQGTCKGTSKGPFTDKNMAVKVAAKKMSDKRAMMIKNNQ